MARYIVTDTKAHPIGHSEMSVATGNWAKRMICASICAYDVTQYYDKNRVFNPTKFYWDQVLSTQDVSLITADVGWFHPARDAAFVTTTTDDWVVLALRGTLPPSSIHGFETFLAFFDDWVNDAKSRQTSFYVNGTYNGAVHTGFLESYSDMYGQIKLVLDRIDWSKYNGLQVTGHSKGAVLTFPFAMWAHDTYTSKGLKTVEVNAFAAPAFGDSYFTSQYKTCSIKTTRHQRDMDIVPFLLPTTSGPYGGFDVYNQIKGLSLTNLTADAIGLMGDFVNGNYSTASNVTYYPNPAPGHFTPPPPISGKTGEDQARSNIITAITNNAGWAIPDAHSAIKSYYPYIL